MPFAYADIRLWRLGDDHGVAALSLIDKVHSLLAFERALQRHRNTVTMLGALRIRGSQTKVNTRNFTRG